MNIWCWSSLTPGHTPPKWQVLHTPPGLRLTHGKFYLSFMQWGNSVGSGLTLLQHWGLRDVQDLTTQMPWSLGGMLWAETKAQSGSCTCLGVNLVQCEKKKKSGFSHAPYIQECSSSHSEHFHLFVSLEDACKDYCFPCPTEPPRGTDSWGSLRYNQSVIRVLFLSCC